MRGSDPTRGDLAERLADVRGRVERAARAAGRAPEQVRVIAVSKLFPASRVLEALEAGQTLFGENRVQEATAKLAELDAATRHRTEWHLVGQLQRNKARKAVELFDVIHSLDRARLAAALAGAAQELGRRPQVLLQIDLDGEPQKGGAPPEAAAELLAQIDSLPELEPVGLMAIPRASDRAEDVASAFARLRELQEKLNAERPADRRLRELSMGMSADFEIAIREGATLVRVGTAIFGPREAR